ncbi:MULTISPECIES: hypothetical protein [unclassified Nocardioides]|uniref:hypothetical protein n=1 Tax=unclassified Nocardioides TaxID=2615069 RepID=UPI0012F7511F|nr:MULTISPECIES: hypothetical protein [unclassified Nocardioides]
MKPQSFNHTLRVLERLLTAGEPAPLNNLVHVRENDEFFAGTSSRVLRQQIYRRPSGLLVPESALRGKNLLDHMHVYLTAEETLGQVVDAATLARWFGQMSVEHAVRFAGHWMAKLEQPGSDRHDVDAAFLDYFAEPRRTVIQNVLRDPNRALVIPQALLFMARLALLHSPSQPWNELDGDKGPVLATMGLTDHLSDAIDDDEELVVTRVPGQVGRELIANQLFNAREDLRTMWATFQRCWREMPVDMAADPRMRTNLPTQYLESTGVDLGDLVLATGALASHAIVHGQATVPLTYLSALGWSAERLDAVLSLFAATPQQLRQMLNDEAEKYPSTWSTRTFDQFPVVRWADSLTVLSTDKVARRAAGLWPMYDILRELESNGSKVAIGQVRETVAYAYETWVVEAFAGIVGDERRLYREDECKRAYPKSKVADAVLDYPDGWVVVEITTPGLKAATAAGISDAAVVQDINNCVRKAQQLDTMIANLRRDERSLTHTHSNGPRRFYPVLVIADRFAANPILMTLLWERLEELRVLQGDDVAPLEVLELEDLDVLEGLIESEGPDLVTILREKEKSAFRGGTMQQYIVWGRGVNPEPPTRVRQRCMVWADLARKALAAA